MPSIGYYFERNYAERNSFQLGTPRKIKCSAIDPSTQSSYFALPGKYNWYQAAQMCKKSGGHLAKITSAEQNLRILYSIPPGQDVWIGASNTNRRRF